VLDEVTIDEAVEPFLGLDRKTEDVDQARAALEAVYRKRGFKTVTVSIPKQTVHDGVIVLQVNEATVGHLNVVGSSYHSIDQIKTEAPSLAEGTVPDFNQVQKDLVTLNQQPDRRVTPALKAGATPGTVDIDLVVDDHLPLHGSLELNNRRSEDTSELRTVGTLSYDNLWQLGHSLSLSYQTAPQDTSDARVLYGSYLARLDGPWSLLINGLHSDSNVATVGGTNVVGNGNSVGVRGVLQMQGSEGYYPTLSFGVDYKRFKNLTSLGGASFETPVEYYPFTIAYSSLLHTSNASTQTDVSVGFADPRLGSDTSTIELNRSFARGQMLWLRQSVSNTVDWPIGLQTFVRVNSQLTDQPLISNEQISAGGLDTVRGYLESEVLGDFGLSGALELRSPEVGTHLGSHVDDLRLFTFMDGAKVRLRESPPDQKPEFGLLSSGVGLNLRMFNYLYGAVDWADPFFSQSATKAWHSRVLFRVWTSF